MILAAVAVHGHSGLRSWGTAAVMLFLVSEERNDYGPPTWWLALPCSGCHQAHAPAGTHVTLFLCLPCGCRKWGRSQRWRWRAGSA